MISQADQESINIFQQIFEEFCRVNNIENHEKEHYILECSGKHELPFSAIADKAIKKIDSYIQCFFFTQVTLNNLHLENSETLVIPCHFSFIDDRIVQKKPSITGTVEIKIKTDKANSLYKKYRSNVR